MSRHGGNTTASTDPLLEVNWIPELLRVRTATQAGDGGETPAEGAAPARPADEPAAKGTGREPGKETGKDGEADKGKEADKEKEKDLGRVRGLELPRGTEKPVLVYFHWPHEDGDRGKRIVKFCTGPLDDEAFVRVTPLFCCIEVNTRDSDTKLVDEAGVKSAPSILVCRTDGAVAWRTDDAAVSGRALAEELKRVLRDRFPGAWSGIEKEMEAQRKSLAEARRFAADGKTAEALAALDGVVSSDVRFTEDWAEAVKEYRDLARKAEDEARKKEPGK